jgi:hypothetical protein
MRRDDAAMANDVAATIDVRRIVRRATAGVAALAVAWGVPAAAGAWASTAAAAGPPPASTAGCTHAVIAGKRVCLASGQLCRRNYERQYERYKFACTRRDRRGRYHLGATKQTF